MYVDAFLKIKNISMLISILVVIGNICVVYASVISFGELLQYRQSIESAAASVYPNEVTNLNY